MTELDTRLAALLRTKEDTLTAIAGLNLKNEERELAVKEVVIHALAAEAHLKHIYQGGFHVTDGLASDTAHLEQDQQGGIEGYRYLYEHFAHHVEWMRQVPRQLATGSFAGDFARLSARKRV